jgi:ABC-type sugar transport system ATPase subunit
MNDIGVALELNGVSKSYPGQLAVDKVDLTVRTGEIHALIGENGAGKSTLMKIIAGSFDDYTGEVFVSTKNVRLFTPAAAQAVGIAMIHQELSLAAPLSIAENILAGRLPARCGIVNRHLMVKDARRWLGVVGLSNLDPLMTVESISQHEAQLVEIAKALASRPCILVMDEPTSALSREEVQRLFTVIRRLRRDGLAIIYISHHLPEILEIADRVTVMRDGQKVGTYNIAEVSEQQLAELMIGGAVSDLYGTRKLKPGEEQFVVNGYTRYGFFHDVSFFIRKGEILGLGGLSGSGRSELARSLCGIDPVDKGSIVLGGKQVKFGSYGHAVAEGVVYLSEDRKGQGLAQRLSVKENALSAIIPRHSRWGIYSETRGSSMLYTLLHRLEIMPPDPKRIVGTLSGGNQQKVLLAKWLATQPEVLILDEPTRGVDVGAKVLIHKAIAEMADSGKCVLLISSDLPELVGLSDRIIIMCKGHVIGEMDRARATETSVLLAANGERGALSA